MTQGQLIPDALVIEEFQTLWGSGRFDKGFIFDGFPRTVKQLSVLEGILSKANTSISKAVLIDASDALVLQRLSGRRVCPACDAIYNVTSMPPAREGICDKCGSALIQRTDDNEDTIRQRLQVYRLQTADILARFSEMGLLMTVDSSAGVDKIVGAIKAGLAVHD